ncbi:hypothetical protein [Flavobacterium ginsenosidimutans]|uniref:Uncharacterized protein n=1 Tax=Flavobacterium ginsenosidimutans TaxID=687844 RepID=A0ABZ2Q7Q3_9FLAO
METEKALQIVFEKLIEENSIPSKIRNINNVEHAEYCELINAINFLIESYKINPNIPKKLALAFVDISNYFFVSNLNYSEEDLERFEDYGIELSALGQKLFS